VCGVWCRAWWCGVVLFFGRRRRPNQDQDQHKHRHKHKHKHKQRGTTRATASQRPSVSASQRLIHAMAHARSNGHAADWALLAPTTSVTVTRPTRCELPQPPTTHCPRHHPNARRCPLLRPGCMPSCPFALSTRPRAAVTISIETLPAGCNACMEGPGPPCTLPPFSRPPTTSPPLSGCSRSSDTPTDSFDTHLVGTRLGIARRHWHVMLQVVRYVVVLMHLLVGLHRMEMESLCLLTRAFFCIYRNRNLLLLSPMATPGRLLGYYSRLRLPVLLNNARPTQTIPHLPTYPPTY
jgi:hypothetical protein